MAGAPLPRGTRLGAFEIDEFIAEGGMGAVYKARHLMLGEPRAVKVVRPELFDEDLRQRFLREVRIAASVSHPNLVRTYDPAMDGEVPILPMELLQGRTLSSWLKMRGGRVEPDVAVAILLPICGAVAAVHARGVIHRDLKPANIFMALDGRGGEVPKVLDFGCARAIDGSDEQTRTGLVFGTECYMAPEQAMARKDLDTRADQYALGVIAYQMLTSARPYESGDDGRALAKLLQRLPYARPCDLDPRLPAPLDAAVMRALAWDRDQRFPSVTAFAEALAAALAGNCNPTAPIQPRVTVDSPGRSAVSLEPAATARSGTRRSALRVGALVAVAMSSVAGGALVVAMPGPSGSPVPAAAVIAGPRPTPQASTAPASAVHAVVAPGQQPTPAVPRGAPPATPAVSGVHGGPLPASPSAGRRIGRPHTGSGASGPLGGTRSAADPFVPQWTQGPLVRQTPIVTAPPPSASPALQVPGTEVPLR